MKRPRVNVPITHDRILMLLHYVFAEGNGRYFYSYHFENLIAEASPNVIEIAKARLLADEYISKSFDDQFRELCAITERGIDHVEGFDDDYYDHLANGVSFDQVSLNVQKKSAAKAELKNEETPENPTDQWEPLPVDRQAKEYVIALDATEKAIAVIEADNGFAATEPDKRDGILATLKHGVEVIRSNMVTRLLVSNMVIKPLAYIVEKFGENAVAEFAKTAVQKILAWIGTFS